MENQKISAEVFSKPTRFRTTFVQCLKDIALITACTSLWAPIHSYKFRNYDEFGDNWQTIEDKIVENVCQLQLPKWLKEQIKCHVRIIGQEIFKWIQYHDVNFSIPLADDFCWTQHGTIDKKKTAEVLIRKVELATHIRYQLACVYCLKNYIPVLWNGMHERQRIYFCQFRYSELLVKYWTCMVSGDEERLNGFIRDRFGDEKSFTPRYYAFLVSAEYGNLDAAEYFWEKLTTEERNVSLSTTAEALVFKYSTHHRERTDFLEVGAVFFVLSLLTENELADIFAKETSGIFHCLTEWPWHCLLFKTLDGMSPKFLDERKYLFLLKSAALRKSLDCENCVYKQIFTDIWMKIPMVTKKDVLSQLEKDQTLLVYLFRFSDKKNMTLIFQQATGELKKKILLSEEGFRTCHYLIIRDMWDCLEFFTEECLSTKDDVLEFRQKFTRRDKYLEWRRSVEHREKVRKFQEILFNVVSRMELTGQRSSPY